MLPKPYTTIKNFQTTNQKLLLVKVESQNFEVRKWTQKEMLPKSLIPTQKQQQRLKKLLTKTKSSNLEV
jgi:hypothetical protein